MPKREARPHWAVGETRPGHETAVKKRWTNHCEVYLPVVQQWRRPAGKRAKELVDWPLFTGYLFINVDTVTDPDPLYADSGLLHFIDIDGPTKWIKPVLTDEKIGEVRSLEGQATVEPMRRPLPVFVIGEQVKIPDGPFAGFTGWVVGLDGKRRVWIDLNLFGRSRPISVPNLTLRPECA